MYWGAGTLCIRTDAAHNDCKNSCDENLGIKKTRGKRACHMVPKDGALNAHQRFGGTNEAVGLTLTCSADVATHPALKSAIGCSQLADE
jgi:hypothetical protein